MSTENDKNSGNAPEKAPITPDATLWESVKALVQEAGVGMPGANDLADRIVVRLIREGNPPIQSLSAYVRTAAKNHLITESRRKRRLRERPASEDRLHTQAPLREPSEEASRRETRVRLYAAIVAQLSSEEAWLLKEYYFEERTLREIAEDLGISAQAVHKRIGVTLEKMRRHFSTHPL